MRFLRFLSRPSSLDIPDDPEFRDNQVLAFSRELQPRPSDNGFLSIWSSDEKNKDFLIAGFCSRRDSLKVASYFEFSALLADNCKLSVVPEPDNETYICLRDFHYSCSMIDEDKVLAFARLILDKLRENSSEILTERLSKNDVLARMKTAVGKCMIREIDTDFSPGKDWAQKILRAP